MFSMEARQQRRGQVDGTMSSPLAGVGVRVVALLAFAVLAFVLWAAPSAQAGTFRVSQCNTADGPTPSPRAIQSSLWGGNVAYTNCNGTGGNTTVGSSNQLMVGDSYADYYLDLPATMPNTTLAGFWMSFNTQPSTGHPSYFNMFTGGARVVTGASGGFSVSGAYYTSPAGARNIHMSMRCQSGGNCQFPAAGIYDMRGLTMNLQEFVALPRSPARGRRDPR